MERFYCFLVANDGPIRSIFGTAPPHENEDDLTELMLREDRVVQFLAIALSTAFPCDGGGGTEDSLLERALEDAELGARLKHDGRVLVEGMRVIARILDNVVYGEVPVSSHPLYRAALNWLNAARGTPTNLPCKFPPAYSRAQKFVIGIARATKNIINDRITRQWQDSAKVDYAEINPDPDFSRRLARLDEIVSLACRASTLDLFRIVDAFFELVMSDYVPSKVLGNTAVDLDLVFLCQQLSIMVAARFKNKVVEVNERGCSCHAKCFGLRVTPELEDAFYREHLEARAGTRISGVSRLSLTVSHTTAYRPRRQINPDNPSLSSVTLDSTTKTWLLPLYHLSSFDDESEKSFRYSHRFYLSNALPVVDAVHRPRIASTASGKYYGLCYGGSRTCWKAIQGGIGSARSRNPSAGGFAGECGWWRCRGCRDHPVYRKDSHLFPDPKHHNGTCVAHLMRLYEKAQAAAAAANADGSAGDDMRVASFVPWHLLCRGCRASLSCKHTLLGYVNSLNSYGVSVGGLQRLQFLMEFLTRCLL